jgi:hypothetical protein
MGSVVEKATGFHHALLAIGIAVACTACASADGGEAFGAYAVVPREEAARSGIFAWRVERGERETNIVGVDARGQTRLRVACTGEVADRPRCRTASR